MIQSMKYCIYKGIKGTNGALQFSFQPPHYYCESCKKKNFTEQVPLCQCHEPVMTLREGNVFVEAASTKGPNVYDWDNKIIMSLSITDMSKLIRAVRLGTELRLLHDPGAGTDNKGKRQKVLQFSSPKGVEAGGIFSLSENNSMDNKEPRRHTVPVLPEECAILGTLLQTAIPRCIGWC